MATSEIGSLNYVAVTASQNNKTVSFNEHEAWLLRASVGLLLFDAVGLSGTQVLTETYSKNGLVAISGALAGAMTLEIDADIQHGLWIKDASTGGVVTIQPTGGSGVVIPKGRWVLYYVISGLITSNIAGYEASAVAAAHTFAANYQDDASNPLKLRKSGATSTVVGGLVMLEGAVEKSVAPVPAVGDTIVTLPAAYRPAAPLGFVCLAESASAANAQPVAIEIQTSGAVILRSLLGWTPVLNVPIDLSGIQFMSGN